MKRKLSKNGPKAPRAPTNVLATRVLTFKPYSLYKGISLDIALSETVPHLAGLIRCIPRSRQDNSLRQVLKALQSELVADEKKRIALVKLLVAFLPDSKQAIHRMLNRFESSLDYEIHFTIFCYLDDVPAIAGAKKLADDIPWMVSEYLRRVRSNIAMAAWMAADLLGDHWEPLGALSALIEVATDSTYRVGRKYGVEGLLKLLPKLPKEQQERVNQLLKEISIKDRSSEVRLMAKRLA